MSLVVTIIIVIILATILIQTSSSLPGDATYVKFSEELINVESAIDTLRTQNAGKGDTKEKINAGFREVTLKNAPNDFESFDTVGTDVKGYLVNLKTIGYTNAEYGQSYDDGKTVIEFLKDDVYVYDATGTVYYVKGIEYKNEKIHTLLEGMDLNMESTADGPYITNITIASGELSDGTKTSGKAKIIISAFPRHGGDLTVMVKNIKAEKMPNGTYVAQVSRNGIYTVAVTEKDGGRTIQRINVTGIVEMNEAPSNLSMIVNNNLGYTTTAEVEIVVKAEGATKMIIAEDNPLRPLASDPRWGDYKTNFTYTIQGQQRRLTLYAWFKDDFSNVTEQIVKATILYDATKPTTNKPDVKGLGPAAKLTLMQTDNLTEQDDLIVLYGYRVYDGFVGYEDNYNWGSSNIVGGSFDNGVTYEFRTKATDEAKNVSLSEPARHMINYSYEIDFDLQGGSGETERLYAAKDESIEITIGIPTKQGYKFVGWSENKETDPTDFEDIVEVEKGEKYSPTGTNNRKILYAIWAARTDMKYYVEHYLERDGMLGEYELKLREEFNDGIVGNRAVAQPKGTEDFPGFVENIYHSQRVNAADITGDEENPTVLKLYYYRGRYSLTVIGENASVTGTMIDVPYEAEAPITAVPNIGYDFDRWVIQDALDTSEEYENFINENGKWNPNATFKMLDKNVVLIAKTGIQKFAITYELNGGTLSTTNPTEYTRETPMFTLNNPEKPGYSFAGWIGTDLIQETLNVTVDPQTLVNIQDRHYEAVFRPTDDLLTITANPTTPTNTTVRAIIECLDPSLRVEYRIGIDGVWDMYVSSIAINENTTVYARVLKDGTIIDEEFLTINNIDTVAPEISDISISEKWNPGEKLLVKVTATDNLEMKGYAVTTTSAEPDEDKYVTENDEIELENGINYIWAKDAAGNVVSKTIYAWDISENENKMVYAFLKDEKELIITGNGKTRSYEENKTPYELYKTKIEKVTIEEGVTSIGNNVLSSMNKTGEIYFPSTLSQLKEDAMLYTNNFDKIEIASGNDYFVYDNYTLYDKNKTTIYIHSSMDQRNEYVIPSTVKEIKKYAFYNNDSIINITVSGNPKLGESAFEKCDNLYRIDGEIGGDTIAARAFADCKNLYLITLSSELKNIGEAAFANTVKLAMLEIPKTLERIVDLDASRNGVFANMGVNNNGVYPRGVVRYYQSTEVIDLYATKYSTEAIFEVIDDIPPEFVELSITSPESGTYAREQEIKITAQFNETLGTSGEISAPKLVIKIGSGVEKEVTTWVYEGNCIVYTYIAQAEDFGKLNLVSYSGTVQDFVGNQAEVNASVMKGSEIIINTAIELYEDDKVSYFASLQDAVDAARTDGAGRSTIKVLKNITESVEISANKDIILNLNEQEITTNETLPVIRNRAKLEIIGQGTIIAETTIISNEGNSTLLVGDVAIESTGINQTAIMGGSNSTINIEAAIVKSKGVVIETSGALNTDLGDIISETGPAINLTASSIAKLKSSNIESHVGYAINVSSSATLDIAGGNVTATEGAAINNKNIVRLTENCNITGPVGILTSGTLDIESATIEGTSEEGSAIENTGKVNMNGGLVKSSVGIGVFNVAGNFEMSGGRIETTEQVLDAVRNNAGAEFTITKGDVYSEKGRTIYNLGKINIKERAVIVSDGFYAVDNRADAVIEGGEIKLNSLQGTAAVQNTGTITINNTEITSNGSRGVTNGLSGTILLEDSVVNVSSSNATFGVHTSSSGKVEIHNTTITSQSDTNTAIGIQLMPNSKVDVLESIIIAVSNSGVGKGISNDGGTITIGIDDGIISSDRPIIEGSQIGYESTSGTLNYYDGSFIGEEKNSIKGEVTSKPRYTYVEYTLANNRENSHLEMDIDVPTNVRLVASTTEWTNKIITLFGEATDEGSGIKEYAITNSATQPADSEWILLEEPQENFSVTKTVTESNIFYLHVKDQTENYVVSNSVETKYDPDPPRMESIEKIPSGWTSGDVTLKIEATDSISGIIGYEFSKVYHDLNTKGNGYTTIEPVERTEQTYLTDNGTIYIYVYDQAGNVICEEVEIDNSDKIAPTIRVEFVEYTDTDAVVKVIATDYESGVANIYMNGVAQATTNIENGKESICTIEHSGIIEFKANDNVGNDVLTTMDAYVITYDANGGEGTVDSQIKLKDQNRVIAENKYTIDKFQFVGWNTKADESGITYNPGDEYAGNENLVLYAIWKDIVAPEITDVILSPDWIEGTDIKLRIFAVDNVDVTHYAITRTAEATPSWSTSNDVTISLGNEVYYVWAKDSAGNAGYIEIKVHDLSKTDAPKTVIGIVKPSVETELTLSIEGYGAIKDFGNIGDVWGQDSLNITTITVKDGITRIGNKSLAGLTNVNTINIPSTVTNIAIDAFVHTNNYSALTVNGDRFMVENGILYDSSSTNLYVTSSKITTGAVEVPLSVQAIAPYAFENSLVTEVTISSNIDIPEGAFYNAKNLNRIISDNEIGGTQIGASAFEGCTSLTELSLSKDLEIIGARAFYNTTALTDIVISKTLTTIEGTEVFVNIGTNAGTDTGKGYVYYYDSNTAMHTYATAAATKDQATFVGIDDIPPVVEEVIINDGAEITNNTTVKVKVIATDNREVTGVYITENEMIDPNITGVTWADVAEEYEYTLSSGTGEKTIYVWAKDKAGNISESSKSASIIYVEYTFNLKGEKEITQYVDTTGKDYYEYREAGYELIGEGITVEVSGTVNHKTVGNYEVKYVLRYQGYEVETVVRTVDVIPNTWETTVIMKDDFRYVTHKTGEYVKIVGYTNSTNSNVLQIPNTMLVNGKEYKVIDVGDGTNPISSIDTRIVTINLPNNIIAVSNNAFSTLIQVGNINYENNLMTIGANAFANSNATHSSITIKNNVREVKQGAFSNTKINKIVIENGVKAIHENAFYSRNNAANEETLEIPASVDYIGTKAFYGYKAKSIQVDDTNQNYADIDGLLLTNKDKTVIYQYSLGNGRNVYTIPDGVVIIAEGAFAESENITEIIMSESVREIRSEAFKNSVLLQKATNVKNLEKIGESAFENTSLQGFEISSNIQEILANTFKNTNIEKMYIPENVAKIGSQALGNITTLKEVIIKDSPAISGDTFAGSQLLEYVLVFDKSEKIAITSALNIPNGVKVYVISKELETAYEADSAWGILGADRIKCLAILNGEKEIELQNGAPYYEEGITLIDETIISGPSTKIDKLSVELISTVNEEVIGEYTVTYNVRYDSELILELVRKVSVTDTIPPEIISITTDTSWDPGTDLKLKVEAIDDREQPLEFSVTKIPNTDSATWRQNNIVTLTPGTNYINVRDQSHNTVTAIVKVWDISKNGNSTVIAYEKENRELIVVGKGETLNFSGRGETPWKEDVVLITKLTLEDGITHLGEYVLSGLENVSEITIPNTIRDSDNVAGSAFAGTNNFDVINLDESNEAFKLQNEYTLMSKDGKRIYIHGRKDTTNSIVIDSNVKYISDSAYYKNNMLEELEFTELINIDKSAFEACLNLESISGEIGDIYLESAAFSGDINLSNITVSKIVGRVGTGIFTNVIGPVYYYASNTVVRQYAKTYPYETNWIVIDDVDPTKDKPTLKASSSTIVATSNQVDEDTEIVYLEYICREDGTEYSEENWKTVNYFTGLKANKKYFVKTRAYDTVGNTSESEEAEIITAKVPDTIQIEASPKTPTNGNVTVSIEWPVADMEKLYGAGWPTGTSVTKQVGILGEFETEIVWKEIKDTADSYEYVVTENNTTIFARLYDGYNYTAQTISLTVNNIDRVAPTGTVTINNGDEEAYEHQITLGLSATDDRTEEGYGVKFYYVSEDPNVDLTKVMWQPYTNGMTHEYTLTGKTSLKTLYVWYMDAAGNISDVASDSIMLVTGVARLEEDGVVTYYDTLKEAIAATTDNPTFGASEITVIRNISQEGNLVIGKSKKILLNMRGRNISQTSTTDVTAITNEGILTIINTSEENSAIYAVTTSGEAYGIYNTGLLDITTVSVVAETASGTGVGIYNKNNEW